MVRKPLELPPEVASAFVKDMRAYFAEENQIKREGSPCGSFVRSESTRDRERRS